MSRPTINTFVRLGLFVAAITVVACASPTSPVSPVQHRSSAVKDSIPPDDTTDMDCRGGYTVVGSRWVCNVNNG
jgi:hypothetical protein